MNGDMVVNDADATELIEVILQTVRGDANLDAMVDGQDFSLLKANFGGQAGWAGGDFNGDGSVDGQDFSLLKANFGFSASVTPAEIAELEAFSTSIIPEPASLLLLSLGGTLMARPRRA
ncbi:MAG: PEP-CTERM sorting domain-containing protein, partial [Rhodospirillales bacterium]|nr:PEP-CTERM sorting domain-containing protein [Rhodospirillales bacterium]